jgi:hypothetical protein
MTLPRRGDRLAQASNPVDEQSFPPQEGSQNSGLPF